MGAKETEDAKNRRIRDRKSLELRVDVKILPKKEVDDILDGAGYSDLSVASLSMSRPRSGMDYTQTLDVSFSGMGLRCKKLYDKGMAAALDLHLPGDRTVLKFLGEVIWADEVAGQPRAGFRIAALDEDSAARFCGYLSTVS
jgi:hypothetical protein